MANMSCASAKTTGLMRPTSSRLPILISPLARGFWNGRFRRARTRKFKVDMENFKARENPSGDTSQGPRSLIVIAGTWVPLDVGRAIAEQHNVLHLLRPLFDFVPGDKSPPPAPKHTTAASTRPKAAKQSAAPKRAPSMLPSQPLSIFSAYRTVKLTEQDQ